MTTTLKVLTNGQEDMRQIARAAIKEAGLSQRAAAAKAGIKYTTLVGFLGARNWLRREDAARVAHALGLALDELVGGSIFKEQVDRYAEFEYVPPKWAEQWTEQDAATARMREEEEADLRSSGRTRALCCQCGSLRTCTSKSLNARYDGDPAGQYASGTRLRTQLKCYKCKETTKHALLRLDDDRDEAESYENRPTRHAEALAERDAFIRRLGEFNVEVHLRSRTKKNREGGWAGRAEFDDSKGHWRLEVDPNLPPRGQVGMLEEMWSYVSKGDFSDVSFDPRRGVLVGTSQKMWEQSADELMVDLTRFLNVERTKLAMHAQDLVAADVEHLTEGDSA